MATFKNIVAWANSMISNIHAWFTERRLRDRSVPRGGLVLYLFQPASPTGWSMRYKRLITKDGQLFEARPGEAFPSATKGQVASEWLGELTVALASIFDEPTEQTLMPPQNAGPAPTCGGTYHNVFVRRGLLGQHRVHIADFDFTNSSLPVYLKLLMAPRLETKNT
jgi:hypothetical protein